MMKTCEVLCTYGDCGGY